MLKVPRGHAYEATADGSGMGGSAERNGGGWDRGERLVEQVAAINIKQNVGKANIVIKNNNNRRASEGPRRGRGVQRESTQPPGTKRNDGYFASVAFSPSVASLFS